MRGVLVRQQSDGWVISIADANREATVSEIDFTNFSLAARRAWQSMPDRKVGRPPGSRVSDRVSVTLRFDRDLWEGFRVAEHQGLVADRTEIFNTWLRDYLRGLTYIRRRNAS